jgi:hypothetical protein
MNDDARNHEREDYSLLLYLQQNMCYVNGFFHYSPGLKINAHF